MKKILALVFALIASLTLAAGCGSSGGKSEGKTFTYKDQTITAAAQPKRIATLTAPLLNLTYAVGGTSVARPSTTSSIPEAAKDLPEVGRISHIDMEKLVGLTPDLVLGEKAQQKTLEGLMQSNKIPFLLVNYDGINDNVPLMKFLGEVCGTEDKAAAVIADYEKGIEAAKAEARAHTPARIAILRATGKDVTAETPLSITASMAEALGMNNVITSHKEMKLTTKTVPYSLEQLSADDPDIIFVVTMGKETEINKKLDEEMRANPAWSALKAVGAGRVYFLPSELFLMNPGVRTPEAMEKLIELAYKQK